MKKYFLLLIVFATGLLTQAQVAINSTGAVPDASSGLDITFTNRGLLIPRVALTATNAAGPVATPANSLLVFNTATAGASPNNVWPGYYYWDTTTSTWKRVLEGKDAWMTTGNTGTTSPTSGYGVVINNNFIGTKDAVDFTFATNNYERMRIKSDADGNTVRVGIGTAFATAYPSGLTSTLLHVFDAGTNAADFSQLQLGSAKTTAASKIGELNFHSALAATDRRTASIESYITAVSGLNPSGDLRFFTNNSATATFTEKMRIQGDGNVGIGTIAPTQKLHIAGNTLTTGDMFVNASTTGTFHWGTAGLLGSSPSFNPNSGAAGLWIEGSQDGESGGMFMNGNTMCLWSPGDNDILRVYDEDLFASGPQMVLNTSGYLGVGLNLSPVERIHTSGNMRADGVVYWGNGLVRTETRDNAGLRGDAGARSGFFETASPTNFPAGAASWWHLIDVRHSNNANNYALQIAGSFFDQDLYFRKTNDNAAQPWKKIVTWDQLQLNTYGTNNQGVSGTTDITLNTTAWTDMSQMTITFTPVHSVIYLNFTFAAYADPAYWPQMYCDFRIIKDGVTNVGGSNCLVEDYDDVDGVVTSFNGALNLRVAVTAGVPTTFKVQWRRDGLTNGPIYCNPATEPDYAHRSLIIID